MKLILNNCDFVIRKFDASILQPTETVNGIFTSENEVIGSSSLGVCYKYDVTDVNKVRIDYGVVPNTGNRTEYATLRNGIIQFCQDRKLVESNEEKSVVVDVSTCDELYVNYIVGSTIAPKVKTIDGDRYNFIEGVTENGYYNKSGEFKSSGAFICKKYDVSAYGNIDAIGAGEVSNGIPMIVLLDSDNTMINKYMYDDTAEGRTTTRSTIDVSGATTMIVNSLALITPTALVKQ